MKKMTLSFAVKSIVKAIESDAAKFLELSHAQKLDALSKCIGFSNFKAVKAVKDESLAKDCLEDELVQKVQKLGQFEAFDLCFKVSGDEISESVFEVNPKFLLTLAQIMECAKKTKQSVSFEAPCCEARNEETESRTYYSFRVSVAYDESLSCSVVVYDKHFSSSHGAYSEIKFSDLLSFIESHDRTKSTDLEYGFWIEENNILYCYPDSPSDFSDVEDFLFEQEEE